MRVEPHAISMPLWIQFHMLAVDNLAEIDRAIVLFLGGMFASGDHLSEANKLVASFAYFSLPSSGGVPALWSACRSRSGLGRGTWHEQ